MILDNVAEKTKYAYYILIEKSDSKLPAEILDGMIILIWIFKKQNVGCVLGSGDSGTCTLYSCEYFGNE
jgi:hypothetical protein